MSLASCTMIIVEALILLLASYEFQVLLDFW
jgi:hypothetical protein